MKQECATEDSLFTSHVKIDAEIVWASTETVLPCVEWSSG